MKNKKFLIVFLLVILGVGVFLIVDQMKTTTFGEVLTNLLDEDENITEIYIHYYYPPEEEKKMVLNDKDEIDQFIEQSSDMILKPTNKLYDAGYIMFFRTDNETYAMTLGRNEILRVSGHVKDYQIVGENQLIEVIESFDEKWELRE
ncbi:hypothetical protein GCM10010965_31520 [Caldalkalibacillus thermarum]|uniref:hypothetical protein n=1 Tax=Caldalkalibacillus thermarum TaxID=296745 RepID=UPI00166746B2|nr:hypothetical protein [Caldalkalibacillus thermarum]GGK36234.1 hypothetical protein GCM10010965_31520 [Caldalkalibacillus thermarum]